LGSTMLVASSPLLAAGYSHQPVDLTLPLIVPRTTSGVPQSALAAANNRSDFEGEAWLRPPPVSLGFARFASLFDRIAIVCYESTCEHQRSAWPLWLQERVVPVDGHPVNMRLGVADVIDHGYKVTLGHSEAWKLLGKGGVSSVLILEDDYRPINKTVAAFAEPSGAPTLEGMRSFVSGADWQMLRVGYIPHDLPAGGCSALCECVPSVASPNVCQVTLPAVGGGFCATESMAAYAVHASALPELMAYTHATFRNYSLHSELVWDAQHTGSNVSTATGWFSTPVDTYLPATLRRMHYLTPGMVVQQAKPLQLVNMTHFGEECNRASQHTPMASGVYAMTDSELCVVAKTAVGQDPTKLDC